MNAFGWLMEIFFQSTGTEKFLISVTSRSRLQPFACENRWLQDGNAAVHKLMYSLDVSTNNTERQESCAFSVLISVHQASDQLWAAPVAGIRYFSGSLLAAE